jgi:hypothetical protein
MRSTHLLAMLDPCPETAARHGDLEPNCGYLGVNRISVVTWRSASVSPQYLSYDLRKVLNRVALGSKQSRRETWNVSHAIGGDPSGNILIVTGERHEVWEELILVLVDS